LLEELQDKSYIHKQICECVLCGMKRQVKYGLMSDGSAQDANMGILYAFHHNQNLCIIAQHLILYGKQ